MITSRWISTGMFAAMALGLTIRHASAQTALGAGNALDNNLGVGTGGINQAAAGPNYRDRNLLVTGDVIGGRGFRDTVGYTAASDFRDRLGSNDLFRFRADSAIASPQLFQLGTTYEQLRFGQAIGMVEYRRAGSGDPASMVARDPIALSDPIALRRMDRQALVNSLAFTQQQTVEPRVIGSTVTRDGTLLYFNASPVRGVVAEPASQAGALIGLSTYDSARLLQDALRGKEDLVVGNTFTTQFDQIDPQQPKVPGPELQPPATPVAPTGELTGSQRLDAAVTSQHQAIVERMVERYAGGPDAQRPQVTPQVLRDIDQSYKQLREQLTRQPQATDQIASTLPGWQTQTQPGAKPGQPLPGTPIRDTEAERRAATPETPVRGLEHLTPAPATSSERATALREPGVDTSPKTRDELAKPPIVKPELAGALRHGLRVDQLSTAMQSRFNELVESAEKSLSEGDYFLAERRFERALRLVPGHPMASVGMAHAQLGAGLYLSASLTLRTLLAAQPEMIDVTYAPHLLPTPERLKAALDAIRTRMTDTQSRDRAAYGFLLAYIGHQTSDQALVREGLATMAEGDSQSALRPLLEQIWLDEQSAPATPSGAAAPAGQPQK